MSGFARVCLCDFAYLSVCVASSYALAVIIIIIDRSPPLSMVGVWLVALVSALEGLNISQPITWYDPVGDVLQDGLVCVEARPGGPHEPTPQPEQAYKRETPMMNLDWTHLRTGANGTNMSSCIVGITRSPLNDE